MKNLLIILLFFTSCSPKTQEINISQQELNQEELIQRTIAKKYKKKVLPKTFKSEEIYLYRLNKVAKPLLKATDFICPGGCQYSIKISSEPILNAWADGKSITFTKLMMEFLDNQNELATIFAHELTHNALGHIPKQRANNAIGSLLDLGISAIGWVSTGGVFNNLSGMAYSQSFENEADYVGLYLMARANFPIKDSANIWRKMSVQHPSNIKDSFFASHPSNAERYLKMEKTIDEIKVKGISFDRH